jgi:hypothetical protein
LGWENLTFKLPNDQEKWPLHQMPPNN